MEFLAMLMRPVLGGSTDPRSANVQRTVQQREVYPTRGASETSKPRCRARQRRRTRPVPQALVAIMVRLRAPVACLMLKEKSRIPKDPPPPPPESLDGAPVR
jgi:hypothetical protein